MRKIYLLLFITYSLLLIHSANAQNTKTQSKDKPAAKDSSSSDTSDFKRSLTIEIDYGTNRGYQLRRKTAGVDSGASQKYIMPNINYQANSGFYSNVGYYKTPGAKKSWDEFFFGLGWDFKISKSADVDGSAGYTHYTYNQASKKNSFNPTTSELTAYIKHDFDVVALKLTGDYYFGGTSSDEDVILDIDHEFYIDKLFSKKDELTIDPTFSFIAATLNYYRGSIQIPAIPAKATETQKAEVASIIATLNNLSQFRFTYYEFALPFNYETGKFEIEIAWRYDVPSDLLPSNLSSNVSDKLSPFLNVKPYSYITAYISFDFLK